MGPVLQDKLMLIRGNAS